MLLKKIEIKNYKSIDNLTIKLNSNIANIEKDIYLNRFKYSHDKKTAISGISIFYGRNAIGKTSLLTAIGLIGDIINGDIQKMIIERMVMKEKMDVNIPGSLSMQRAQLDAFKVDVKKMRKQINSLSGEYFEKFLVASREFYKIFYRNNAKKNNKNILIKLTIDTKNGDKEISFICDAEGNINFILPNDKENLGFKKYLFWISSDVGRYTSDGNIMASKSRQGFVEDINFLSFLIVDLKNRLGEDGLLKLIKLADNTIGSFIFQKRPNGIETTDYYRNNTGDKINILNLSQGTRHFLLLLGQITFPMITKKAAIILIDEIDISLHAELIDSLKFLMKRLFEKYNVQFIITTHSPFVANKGLSYKQIFSIEKENNIHVIKKMSDKLKPKQSILKAYERGGFAQFPDVEFSKNVIASLKL